MRNYQNVVCGINSLDLARSGVWGCRVLYVRTSTIPTVGRTVQKALTTSGREPKYLQLLYSKDGEDDNLNVQVYLLYTHTFG